MKLGCFSLQGIKSNDVRGDIDYAHMYESGTNKKYFKIITKNNNKGGMIVRTLQLANSFGNAIVQLVRLDANDSIMFRHKFNMKSNDYLLLWEGFIYLPPGMQLACNVDIQGDASLGLSVYASVILQDEVTNTTII